MPSVQQRLSDVLRPWLEAAPSVFFVVAIATVALNLAVSWSNLNGIRQDTIELVQVDDLRSAIDTLDRAVTSAETGQRGYLLTGDNSYLEPYHFGRAKAAELIEDVASMATILGPKQADSVRLLRRDLQFKLDVMDEIVDTFDDHGGQAALSVVQSDRGLQAMEAFQTQQRDLGQTLASRVSRIRDRVDNAWRVTITSILGSGAVTIVFLSLAFMSSQRQLRLRREALHTAEVKRVRLAELNQVGLQLTRATDVPSMLGIVASQARRLLNAEVAAVAIRDTERSGAVSVGPAAHKLRMWKPHEEPLELGEIAEQAGDLAVKDASGAPPPRLLNDVNTLHNAAAVGLKHRDGSPLGHVLVGDIHRDGVSAFDLLTLSQLGQMLSVAHENASLVQELQRLAQEREHFMSVLGHELRNPLNAISGASQVLRRRVIDGPLHGLVQMVDRQTVFMRGLIDELLDVARIERGTMELERELLDVALIVQEAVNDYRTSRPELGDRLHAEIPSTEVRVLADSTRITQLTMNLLDNAAKFGGDKPIHLHLGTADGMMKLQVTDQGQGMRQDELARIFERYAQGENSGTAGLGLGLALVDGIVRLHGGTVRAESDGPGMGSTFTVSLPLAKESLTRITPPSHDVKLRTILIVDDREDARAPLCELLTDEGHTVLTADSAESGLTLARETPALTTIISDISMGSGMDGYAFAEAIREDSRLKHLHVIALTGFGTHLAKQRSREAGFDHHLTKPMDLNQLRSVLLQHQRSNA